MPVKMRTLPQAAAELKAADPGTAVTLSTLRLLVKRGDLPVVHIRNRQLIDMDTLATYLRGNGPGNVSKPQIIDKHLEKGVIRKIAER